MRFATLAAPTVDIGSVQTIRRVCLLLTLAFVAVAFVISTSRWPSPLRGTIAWIGLALIAICISGRTWCALYIGGRKTSELVTIGPYSLCRNPLYLFSIIGAVGVGAQLGTASIALLAGLFTWAAHVPVVAHEERLLQAEHRDRYLGYLARVPRFLPRFSGWQDVQRLEVRPRAAMRTFADACYFLAAAPLAALIEHLHDAGAVSVLVRLP